MVAGPRYTAAGDGATYSVRLENIHLVVGESDTPGVRCDAQFARTSGGTAQQSSRLILRREYSHARARSIQQRATKCSSDVLERAMQHGQDTFIVKA